MSHMSLVRSKPTFIAADTRKCTKVIIASNPHHPIPRGLGAGKNPSSSKSNNMFTAPTNALPLQVSNDEAQGLVDFESWYVAEEEEDQGNPLQRPSRPVPLAPSPHKVRVVHHHQRQSKTSLQHPLLPSQPPLGFGSTAEELSESLSLSSTNDSLCGLSTGNAVTSARLKVACFREDLDENEQRGTIRAYRKERDELWVAKMQLEGSSVVKYWTKRQQALSLALLVAEAHIFTRSGKATMSTDHLPTPAVATAVSPPVPDPISFQVKDTEVAGMLLHDIFLLVDNDEEGEERYDTVRTELSSLALWR